MNTELARRAKEYALRNQTTFTHIVEQAVSKFLAEPSRPKRRRKIVVPTFRGRGVQPGVDLNDTSSMLDRIDEGVPLEKRR